MTIATLYIWLRARFAVGQRGASYIEYALVLALVAIFAIAAVTFFGQEVTASYSRTNGQL